MSGADNNGAIGPGVDGKWAKGHTHFEAFWWFSFIDEIEISFLII